MFVYLKLLVVVDDGEGVLFCYLLIGGEVFLKMMVIKFIYLFGVDRVVFVIINVYGLIEICVDVFLFNIEVFVDVWICS